MKRSIILSVLFAFAVSSPLAFAGSAAAGTTAPANMEIVAVATVAQDSSAAAASPWESAMGVFAEHTLVVTVILISTAGIVANAAATTGTSGT